MAMECRLVDGAGFAETASQILSAAWPAPSLRYSPEYLKWQLSFPGVRGAAPAVAAVDNGTTIGFAASTPRFVRCGMETTEVLVVSFVAVHPHRRGEGVGGALYRTLLGAIRELGTPVITFAQAGSAGERLIERVYAENDFHLQPLGTYPVYGILGPVGKNQPMSTARVGSNERAALYRTVEECACDKEVLWSNPTDDQLAHYERDPRPRRLLLLEGQAGQPVAAAWAVHAEFSGPRGIQHVRTLECVWLDNDSAGALVELAAGAAQLWTRDDGPHAPIVHAPNLCGFEPEVLRQFGFRRVGAQYRGYLASSAPNVLPASLKAVNVEVI